MEKTNQTGKIILALLAGAATGAAIGILFAPHKGKKTRDLLMNSVKGMADDVKRKMMDEANALRMRAEELEELAKDRLKERPDNVKQRAEVLKHHN